MRSIIVALAVLIGLSGIVYAQRLGGPSLVWQTIHTEHFRVTFPLGLEGLAQEAAVAAEDAHQYLLKQFGYVPSEKIDIVLCDALDTAHRELDIFQNRITIYVAQADLSERFNPKFPSWVQQSVFALYAQLVSADFVFGVSEVLRPLLGKLVLPNLKLSELLEGIGEYLAEEALNTPPDVRPHIGGAHRLVRYLTERFGSEFLKEWHRLQANDLQAILSLGLWSDYDRIFRRLTKESFGQIVAEWKDLSSGPPPTRGGGPSLDRSDKILTIKHDIQRHSSLYGDLYLYDPKTKRETRLTEGARIYRAALFPDGKRVLVAHHRWGEQGPVLAIFDLQTRQMQTIKEFPMHDYFIDSFAISPDSEQIALSIWRRGGFQDIYLMDLSPSPSLEGGWGVRLTPLTRDRAVDLAPTFSPDGHFVLFSSDRDGSFKSYAYRLADGAFFVLPSPSEGRGGGGEGELGLGPQVQIEPEPFPPWDGFPDTDYPITPYDPRPSLEPKILVPLPGVGSLSLLTFGSDALRQHFYSVLLGFNWKTLQPSYSVRYENRVLLASLEALVTRDGLKAHQSLTATLPVITSLSTRQSLALFYRRDEAGVISHQIGLGWDGMWRVSQHWLELSVWAVTQTRTGQRLWENSLGWRVGIATDLSERLRARVLVQSDGQLGVELELFPDALVRVRVLWEPQSNSLEFYLH